MSELDTRRNFRAPRTSKHDRHKDDWYVEPEWSVDALLDVEDFPGSIWDPACGGGTIPKVLARRQHQGEIIATDLRYRGFGQHTIDFLQTRPIKRCNHVISNCPFNIAEQFAAHALMVARFRVALLLRLAFLETPGRADFFEATPLSRVLVFANRVSCPPGDRPEMKAEGGKVAYAWFIWSHDHRGPPTIHFLKGSRPK